MSFVKIGCCIADRGGMLGQTKAAGSACTTARQIVKGMPKFIYGTKTHKKTLARVEEGQSSAI